MVSPTPPGANAPDQLLNSERIERRFGTYDIDLLYQSDTLRVSNLYSTHDGVPTTRTLALVEFANPNPALLDPAIAPLHRQILAGASLGATFKKAGWRVTKRRHRFGQYEVTGNSSGDPMIAHLMRLNLPARLAFHTYQLDVSNGIQTIPYATLTELHHPDYLRLPALQKIYPQLPLSFSLDFNCSPPHSFLASLDERSNQTATDMLRHSLLVSLRDGPIG